MGVGYARKPKKAILDARRNRWKRAKRIGCPRREGPLLSRAYAWTAAREVQGYRPMWRQPGGHHLTLWYDDKLQPAPGPRLPATNTNSLGMYGRMP